MTSMTNIGTVGTVRITEELQDAINYHHNIIGSSTEWNGILFYKHVKGDFSKLKNLEFVAHAFYLMEDGSSAYTKNDFEPEAVIEAYDYIPDAIESLTGKIHTHHNMKAYHSGTDMMDLEHNATVYGFYVSLVVNIAGEYDCKISIPALPTSMTIRDSEGNSKTVKVPGSTMILQGNLNVIMPDNANKAPKWMSDRVKKVMNKLKTPAYDSFGLYPYYNNLSIASKYQDKILDTISEPKSTPYHTSSSSIKKATSTTSILNTETPTERFAVEIMENIILYADMVEDGGIDNVDGLAYYLSMITPGSVDFEMLFDDTNNLFYSISRAYSRIFDGSQTNIETQLGEVIKLLRKQPKSYMLGYFINKLIEVQDEHKGEI